MCADGMNLKYALWWHIYISVYSVQYQCMHTHTHTHTHTRTHAHTHARTHPQTVDSEPTGLKVDIAHSFCFQLFFFTFMRKELRDEKFGQVTHMPGLFVANMRSMYSSAGKYLRQAWAVTIKALNHKVINLKLRLKSVLTTSRIHAAPYTSDCATVC